MTKLILPFVPWLLAVALAIAAWGYRSAYLGAAAKLEIQNNAIEEQNRKAGETLERLTKERDAKQAALERAAKIQEKEDADAQAEIVRLNRELRARPVLVRVVPAPAPGRSGGASPAGDAAAGAGNRAQDAAETIGVLPNENSRRLADAVGEVELLSAAYNSCRARLMTEETPP
ncbi:MAG: hypothetical protein LBR05_01045 [Azoarcus sp.]|jgi:hypothetical protein|nr:hypothetical protein [Azoarcus sp.]